MRLGPAAPARTLYVEELGLDLTNTVYALDSTTIALCVGLSVGALPHHEDAHLDLRGNIPSFIHISDGKLHDVHALDMLLAGAIYVWIWLRRLCPPLCVAPSRGLRHACQIEHRCSSIRRRRILDIICDQGRLLRITPSSILLRPESGKTLVFITNNFSLPAATICALYKSRWQVELFFKWIKQHLRIKQFYGTSENAVKTQIWIAVSVYVLVAIVKKRLDLDASLYTLLQILSSQTAMQRIEGTPTPDRHVHRPNRRVRR